MVIPLPYCPRCLSLIISLPLPVTKTKYMPEVAMAWLHGMGLHGCILMMRVYSIYMYMMISYMWQVAFRRSAEAQSGHWPAGMTLHGRMCSGSTPLLTRLLLGSNL